MWTAGPNDVDMHDEILTIEEVARELRCSQAHVCNAINGRVPDQVQLDCSPVMRPREACRHRPCVR